MDPHFIPIMSKHFEIKKGVDWLCWDFMLILKTFHPCVLVQAIIMQGVNKLSGEKLDQSSLFIIICPHVPMFPRLAVAAQLGRNALAKQVYRYCFYMCSFFILLMPL